MLACYNTQMHMYSFESALFSFALQVDALRVAASRGAAIALIRKSFYCPHVQTVRLHE